MSEPCGREPCGCEPCGCEPSAGRSAGTSDRSGDARRDLARLVLWDVDGTLLNAAGFGWQGYGIAFQEVFGCRLCHEVPMAGRTDRAIMLDVLREHDIAPDDRLDERISEYQAALERFATENTAMLAELGGCALPGAAAALAAFAARTDVVSSVLTGNLPGLAEAKLAAVGLDGYLDLAVGAYGDRHERRADLVDVARELAAAKYGREFPAEATVLVGDTPLDVEAGLARGAAVVAVATGRYAAADLTAAGAQVVLPDLTDTASVVSTILAVRGLPAR